MNRQQREVYTELVANPPAPHETGGGINSAYWIGFHNPDMTVDRAGPMMGAPGSKARGAFWAGQSVKLRGEVKQQAESAF